MKLSSAVGLALGGALAFASVAAAQRPTRSVPATPSDDKVGVAIALQAGGESFRFTGQAACTHEPNASIYMVAAQQWRVAQSDGTRNMSLTFWRPARGSGDMFTLYLQGSGKTYMADTVKTRYGGSPKGSGQVTFAPAGAGGTFTVTATTENGAKISGTIKCDGFRALMAVAGN